MEKKSVSNYYKDARILSPIVLLIAFAFTFQYADAALPLPPTGLTAQATGPTSIILSWTAPAATPTISGYKIDRESPIGGGFATIVANTGTTATTFTNTNLTPFTQYNYRVFTINGSGTGTVPSNTAAATTILAGGGCKSDCTPPTLGVGAMGRVVSDGFTINSYATDVDVYDTSTPLQTIKVGEPNTAVLKIYEDGGTKNIAHAAISFDMKPDQFVGQSSATIIWEQNFAGIQSVSVDDRNNVLMDVNAVGKADGNLLIITFKFTFKEPIEPSKVGITVWDQDRNAWQYYFNDGIEVVGKSLNPPKQIQVLDRKGYPVIITMTGKNTGVDQDGNLWTHNSPWEKQSQPVKEEYEPSTMHGIDRTNSMFSIYKKGQELIATDLVKSKYGTGIYQFFEFPHLKSINDPYVNRADDAKLKQKMLDEELRAMKKVGTECTEC